MPSIAAMHEPVVIDLVEPLRHPLQSYVDQLHERHRDCREGEVATYIPELGRANPEWFAIAVATADGQVYRAGDWSQAFSIQSISKPFVYGLALADQGLERVSRRVGVEPSGEAFNSISLDPRTGRPLNPMINAGAIASAAMVSGADADERMRRILEMFSRFTGHAVQIDEQVYRSESSTGFRNRAIANLLRNFEMIDGDPDAAVEVYFKQCSILTDCRDLAVMAATLAAGGVCPVTGERALPGECVRHMLSVMTSCGMYDFAGEWIFRVGMPGKSGVSGGVIGVLPGQMGVAVFSPRLDPRGNSVRGIRVFNDLAAMLGLHMFNRPGQQRTFIRARYDGARVRSKRLRPIEHSRTLAHKGKAIGVWDLQGNLPVYAVELVIRDVLASCGSMRYLILDLRRVTGIDRAGAGMLARFAADAIGHGHHVLLTHTDRHHAVVEAIDHMSVVSGSAVPRRVADVDAAIEWCENDVLHGVLESLDPPAAELEHFELVRSLGADELAVLRAWLREGFAHDGELVIREGDEPDGIYFLMEGSASVTIDGPDGQSIRVASLSPVMTFGEMGLLDRRRRSASVRANGAVRFMALSFEGFDRLRSEHPHIAIKMLENLACGLSEKLRKANEEIGALSA